MFVLVGFIQLMAWHLAINVNAEAINQMRAKKAASSAHSTKQLQIQRVELLMNVK
jgi:hypothetical protein